MSCQIIDWEEINAWLAKKKKKQKNIMLRSFQNVGVSKDSYSYFHAESLYYCMSPNISHGFFPTFVS